MIVFSEMSVERQYDDKGLKRYARVITGYVATHAVSGQDNSYSVEMETLKREVFFQL